jgi:phage gp36-like protein
MAYLQKSDYTLRIAIDHLDEILEQAASTSGLTTAEILANAELLAFAEVRSYLVSKYLIGNELQLSGAARNMLIVRWCIDIALYTLHFTVNPRDIPEIREKAYKSCMDSLAAARDANIVLEIPQVDPFYSRHLIGSNQKFVSNEFTDPTLYPNCP